MHRNKRTRHGQAAASTTSILTTLNGHSDAANHEQVSQSADLVAPDVNVPLSHEINHITSLEAELNQLQPDLSLLASLIAVLERETEKLEQSAQQKKEHINQIDILNNDITQLISQVPHVP